VTLEMSRSLHPQGPPRPSGFEVVARLQLTIWSVPTEYIQHCTCHPLAAIVVTAVISFFLPSRGVERPLNRPDQVMPYSCPLSASGKTPVFFKLVGHTHQD
jgi:hypothetical protein